MKTNTRLTLAGTRFGELEYTPEDVVQFPEGLIGFWQLTEFLLICPKEGSNFRWLQSVQEPTVAFLLTDPTSYVGDYNPRVNDSATYLLKIEDTTPYLVYTTANIPAGKPQEMTLNLAAPIVVNVHQRIGAQVLVEGTRYATKHPAFAVVEVPKKQKKKVA